MSETAACILNEVMSTNFKIFDGLEEKDKLKQIDKVHYIDTIARQLEVDLSTQNLFELFPSKDNQITCNHSDINKILVNFEPPKEKDQPIQKLSKTQVEKLKSAANYWNTQQKTQLQNQINSYNLDIRGCYNSANSYIEQKIRCIEQLNQITDNPETTFINQVEEILATQKYRLARIDSDKIIFDINDDIINTYKNPKAGIDIRVNLGKFSLQIKWRNMRSTLIRREKNIRAYEYFHPHYCSSGNPCLGNLSEIMEEAQVNKDLVKIVEINESLMKNYNSGNPYASLEKFAMASQQVQPNGKVIKDPNAPLGANTTMTFSCTECGSDHEIEFDENGHYADECPECGYWDEFYYHDVN
jgi:hypothetical protein